MAAVYVKQSGQSDKIYYAHTDHLGSILSLTDNNGTSVFQATYDAWGRQTVSQNTIGFARGYTGHEHLTEFGLIDMNGRMYDPLLGRFLSPDPYVQMPDLSQNFNRYSYCLNNPLIYTDPSGEFIFTLLATIIPGAQPLLPFAIAADISWMTDYGMQVAMNHMNGQSGSDAWFKNIDWFDVGISAIIGGVTGGYSAEYKALKEGERLSKFGTWVYNNRKLITLGEMVATSAIDITGEGFQKVDMGDFSTRMAINLTTFGLTELASNGTKGLVKKPDTPIAVTPDGVALPKGAFIPDDFIENPYRRGSYGIMEDGKFIEKLRIDPGTLPGFKGPNSSHFHLNGGSKHIFDLNKWPWWRK